MSASTEHARSPLSALDLAPVWLNSEPLTAGGLRGTDVLIDFWTYSCVNWLRTLPYLKAWHETYRDRGAIVVGVHAPEFGFEHDLDNVRRATTELGIEYPVVIDNDYAIWRAFGNHYWPAVYLVDRTGRVGFEHFGEGAYEETERAIQQLLGIDAPTVRIDAGGFAEAADTDTLRSPETYLGAARGERRSDEVLALNQWALTGDWSVRRRKRRARSGQRFDRVSLPRARREPGPGVAGIRHASPVRGAPRRRRRPGARTVLTSTSPARAR